MVDIHSHILPGVDDGAKSWETAVEMVRLAYADGTRHMAATPHANANYGYDRASAEEMLAELKKRCEVAMEFSLGCDLHFSIENVEAALERPEQYCIGGSEYMLVEFSDFAISRFAGHALLRLLRGGTVPIITHPERNPILQQQPEDIVGFAEYGCLVQVTANSLTGFWGERARKTAAWLLDRECVHVIASDAHDLDRRPPILSKARDWLTRRYSAALSQALCHDNPNAIVSGQTLFYLPEVRR